MGLRPGVINTILQARAPATVRSYARKWQGFATWCNGRFDPFSCPVEKVLEYLQSLVEYGRAASTIRAYAAAITACHDGWPGYTVLTHRYGKQFFKGIKRGRPAARPSVPQWDLPLVLDALCEPPFEPLSQASIKWVTIKTALLLALTSAKRSSDLCALSVQADCLILTGDNRKAVLRPNPALHPKVMRKSLKNDTLELRAFHPPPHGQGEERQHRLCPVRALGHYVKCTEKFRSTNQLLVCFGGKERGGPVSVQRVAQWLCEGIAKAYELAGREPPGVLNAHSTRGTSTSVALLRGVSVDEILDSANWASPNVFIQHYLMDVASDSLAHAVLSSAPGSSTS